MRKGTPPASLQEIAQSFSADLSAAVAVTSACKGTCAAPYKRCFNARGQTSSCCNTNTVCVQTGAYYGQCRPTSSPVLATWTVRRCSAPSPPASTNAGTPQAADTSTCTGKCAAPNARCYNVRGQTSPCCDGKTVCVQTGASYGSCRPVGLPVLAKWTVRQCSATKSSGDTSAGSTTGNTGSAPSGAVPTSSDPACTLLPCLC